MEYILENVTTPGFRGETQRTPTVWKTLAFSALGNSVVWTPAAGKRFRLLGGLLILTENASAAAAGVITCSLNDAAGNPIGLAFPFYVPAAAVAGVGFGARVSFPLPGNGYFSAASNNALVANLSVALATGNFQLNVWGTEE